MTTQADSKRMVQVNIKELADAKLIPDNTEEKGTTIIWRRVFVPTAQQGNTVVGLFLLSVSDCFNSCIRTRKFKTQFMFCIVGIR